MNEAIFCRYCKNELPAEGSNYNKRETQTTNLSQLFVFVSGIFGFIYAMAVIYSQWGLTGAAIAFFLFPPAIVLTPIYTLVEYGSWWPIVVIYGLFGLGLLLDNK